MGFRGRIISSIWSELSHPLYEKHKDYFILPVTCLKASEPHRYALKKPKIGVPAPPAVPNGTECECTVLIGFVTSMLFQVYSLSLYPSASPAVQETDSELEGETEGEPAASTFTANAASVGEEQVFYTVHPLVIPLYTEPPLQAKEKDVRRPPRFLQTVSCQLKKHLNCPFAYYRFLSQIQILALSASHPGSEAQAYGAFEEPLYEVLACMEPAEVLRFQKMISKSVWEAYDVEWWFIIKERAYQRRRNTRWSGFDNVKLDLVSFPSTEASFKTWLETQFGAPLLTSSRRFENGTVEISDHGESTCFDRK